MIYFLHPGPAERLKLWQLALPERSPDGTLITDGIDFLGFKSESFPLEEGVMSDEITMRPRGGFVLTLE